MSTYWGFMCTQCKKDDGRSIAETWFNRMPEIAKLCYQVWPHVKAIRELDPDGRIDLRVFGDYGDTDVWDFLAMHYDHGVWLADEYGRWFDVSEEVE